MDRADLYCDIALRTKGEVYVGVVGPVRTGKSTFIKRFMDLMVLPSIKDEHELRRLTDELPQSGAGRTIMTTQPKFVPNEACQIELSSKACAKVRLVDCVGYMVPGALGFEENQVPRMVHTPWSSEPMPFEQAAELGTRKVITDHSTIGVLVTTDGSITDLDRDSYLHTEERVVKELKEQGRPFVVVLNSKIPEEAGGLRDSLAEKYGVPVLALNVMQMSVADMNALFENVLFEFPLAMVRFELPGYLQALDDDHPLMKQIYDELRDKSKKMCKMRDFSELAEAFSDCENFDPPEVEQILLGSGEIVFKLNPIDGLFYKLLGQQSGCQIESDYQLMSMMKDLMRAKVEYDRIEGALTKARATGYGMVEPSTEELALDEPELIRRGNQYGVRLRASGPSLHILRADVNCEVAPIVGTEQQGEELVKFLLSSFENDPAQIWATNIFGKSLHELVTEGVSAKLLRVPENARNKLANTLGRIINEGSGNLICILF